MARGQQPRGAHTRDMRYLRSPRVILAVPALLCALQLFGLGQALLNDGWKETLGILAIASSVAVVLCIAMARQR